MNPSPRRLSRDEYTVACICPMGVELAAVEAMLDEIHESLPSGRDRNGYTLGRMGVHNVVVAVTPEIGNNQASSVVTQLLNDFHSIRFGLLVGIGAGIPGKDEDDIRLGDVVVSKPTATFGGVVQYDKGKVTAGGLFERTGSLNKPHAVLSANVHRLQAQQARSGSQIPQFLSEMQERYPKMRDKYIYQGVDNDQLFEAAYWHQGGSTCRNCDPTKAVQRDRRPDTDPQIHYGTIGSGNAIIKDGLERDQLKTGLGVICVEMEAAGLMDEISCLVIRGVCDYADSHENKRWQPYAAATAAAYAKELLSIIPASEVVASLKAEEALQETKIRSRLSDRPDTRCLGFLRVTDPRVERIRILDSKGDLLKGSCAWVFDQPAFIDWWDKDEIRILWIHGNPGKGKTMMAMAFVDEILLRLRTPSDEKGEMSYFFCQGTVDGLNDAVSIIRGLIYVLVDERRDLLHHVEKAYDNEGSQLLEGTYGLYALWKLLCDILRDSLLPRVYLIIDALDECGPYQAELLRLITRGDNMSSSKVKWLITSRNEQQIQERLIDNDQSRHTSLELHSRNVSDAVEAFIDYKVTKLRKHDEARRRSIRSYLHENANGTFLWVALVCEELQKTPVWKTQSVLEKFPRGLEPLYGRMIEQIWQQEDSKDIEYCRKILCAVTLAYRPLHLKELAFTAELPKEFTDNILALQELVNLCGSFLTLRDNIVYFVHQTAKDYLIGTTGSRIFPLGQYYEHKMLAHRSLALMTSTLKRNICGLKLPGTLCEDISASVVNICIQGHVQYACCFWADHLLGKPSSLSTSTDPVLVDQQHWEQVYHFFCDDFLHWLEALSLIGKISESILAVMDLRAHLTASTYGYWNLELLSVLHDAQRFVLSHRVILEAVPLQTYTSALVFSPFRSVVRQTYAKQMPAWVEMVSSAEEEWSACLQTLEGHSDAVNKVVFTPDGRLVASGSQDHTVRLWDATTGAPRATLEGHSDLVETVVFSPDGRLVASGSHDHTVRLWDATTGAPRATLEGHSGWVRTVVFSPDGRLVASGSVDRTVRLWDATTGAPRATLEGHSDPVWTVVFSPDGRLVASGSQDHTVRLWDATTGAPRATLEGHSSWVGTVVFSPDGRLVASGSHDHTVRLWDATTGAPRATLEGHSSWVWTVVFSPDGRLVASGSEDSTVRLWDARTGAPRATLEGHSGWVWTVVFSPDGRLVASGSENGTVRLWDATTGAPRATLEGHSSWVWTVVFSPDGRLVASGSADSTVRLWDATTGAPRATLEGHSSRVRTVVFSPDGRLVASGSGDHTVRLWDATTGAPRATLEGHSGPVWTVVFSPDGRLVASGSEDSTVRLWDATTGAPRATLEGHSSRVRTVVFSPDGRLVASGSEDHTVRLWDATTGAPRATLEGHSGPVWTVVFSPDGRLVASGSADPTVRLWDATTGAPRATLEGHSGPVETVVFSPDGRLVASGSWDSTVRLWDATTGAPRATLEGHSGSVRTVVFSPDGRLVASGSEDRTVRLWDSKTQRIIRTLESGYSDKLSFSSDGSHLKVGVKVVDTGFGNSKISAESNQPFALDITERWVASGVGNVLWLPPNRRPGAVAIRDTTVVLGNGSGRMTFLLFKPHADMFI